MANKKNEFYWNNYISAADVACRAADYLLACMKGFDVRKTGEMLATMHEFEHEGDSLRHAMTEALAKSFVTPIDREDMQELCQKLDHVTDSIEEVLQSIYFNCIGRISPESIAFAEKICICTAKMKEMLVELPNFKKYEKLHSLIIAVNTAEEECDALYLRHCLAGYLPEAGGVRGRLRARCRHRGSRGHEEHLIAGISGSPLLPISNCTSVLNMLQFQQKYIKSKKGDIACSEQRIRN